MKDLQEHFKSLLKSSNLMLLTTLHGTLEDCALKPPMLILMLNLLLCPNVPLPVPRTINFGVYLVLTFVVSAEITLSGNIDDGFSTKLGTVPRNWITLLKFCQWTQRTIMLGHTDSGLYEPSTSGTQSLISLKSC
jgi:hypothetical protein